MKMLQPKKTAGRGLGRVMTLIVGVSTLLMIAGSAQAMSIDLSSYRGGDASFTAGDHTISVSERRTRGIRSVSIRFNGAEVGVNSVSVALRPGHGVLGMAGGARDIALRRSRRHDSIQAVELAGEMTGRVRLLALRGPIRLHSIDIDVPTRPPVTAVPEPGAALLFGAGIVLAGLRRR